MIENINNYTGKSLNQTHSHLVLKKLKLNELPQRRCLPGQVILLTGSHILYTALHSRHTGIFGVPSEDIHVL